MAARGYTLIDIVTPSGLGPDRARVVRFLEYVRANFHRVVKDLPAECEIDLLASGHAHNAGLAPMLGIWAAADTIDRLPDWGRMTDEVTYWCPQLTPDEVENMVSTAVSPTWEELVRVGVHPARRKRSDGRQVRFEDANSERLKR